MLENILLQNEMSVEKLKVVAVVSGLQMNSEHDKTLS